MNDRIWQPHHGHATRPRWACYRRLGIAALMITLAGLWVAPEGHAQVRRLDLSDLALEVNLSDPRIAPDGRWIAVVVSRPDFDENRFESELVLVEVATGGQRVLTQDRPRVRYPRWSPTGDRIAFLAAGHGDEDGNLQLFVMPTDGGDARQLTNASRGVNLFEWRPDGKDLAFVTEDEPEERTGQEEHNKSFRVGDNDYLATSAPMPSHLWLVSAADGAPRRLTSGDAGVAKFTDWPISWSPDGKLIAFTTQPRPHVGELDRGSVEILDVATGDLRPIEAGPGFFPGPAFSPNGRLLAYSHPLGRGPFFNPHAIYVVPASGGEARNATADLDRTFYRALWLPDSKSILLSGHDRTRVSLWLQPLEGAPKRLDLGAIDPSGDLFGPDVNVGARGAIALIGVEPQRPEELYYLRSPGARPKRLTDFNASLASRQLGAVESIRWPGPDGFEEDGVLIYPPGFTKGREYPLVLAIHGGPMSASTEGFSILPQLMAARDWVVFRPNYRGSDNLGGEYQRAVINDAGDGPGRDVMAGVAAVKARGFVDAERVAVSGWSYGGYMTTWLIGHFQGWRAAVAGAAVTDYIDSYALSDVNVVFGYGFEGSPYSGDRAEAWRRQSPIAYAQNIRTPTLILSNTGDARVPITESYKLYHALTDNGVPVEFVAYPIPGHFPDDPVHRRDVYRRWIEWIAARFTDAPAAASRE